MDLSSSILFMHPYSLVLKPFEHKYLVDFTIVLK